MQCFNSYEALNAFTIQEIIDYCKAFLIGLKLRNFTHIKSKKIPDSLLPPWIYLEVCFESS